MATPVIDISTIAPISVAGSTGFATLASAVAGIRHVLMAAHFGAATATGFICFQSATTTALTASMRHKVAAHFTMPYNLTGWIKTAANESLTIKVTGAGCKAKGVVTLGTIPA